MSEQSEIRGALAGRLSALTAGDAARLGVDLCDALTAAAPERGFHGALYPNNIMLTTDGRVRLGPPLTLGEEFSPDELEFLAPELFWHGAGSPASDVYAIGLILYAACSDGRGVFLDEAGDMTAEKRAAAVQRRMKGEAPREPRDAGDELAQVILRAIAFREEERWPDIPALRTALEDCSVFSAPPLEKHAGSDVLGAAVGVAADAAILSAQAGKADAAGEPAAKPMAPAPRPVAPGARNEDVVVPAPQAPKPPKKPEAKPKPKPEPKPEPKPAPKPEPELKPVPAPAPKKPRPSKYEDEPVPDGRPRPVYDAANEGKKRRRSPLPAIATVIALVVIFLAVLYMTRSSDEPEATPSPAVSAPVDVVTTPAPSAPATAAPETTPAPEATPEPSPEPTPEPTPEPGESFAVSLSETGSADWATASALAAASGGHLPIIRDQSDLTALIEQAEDAGLRYVWLDATRDTDGVWRWSDGTEVTFFQWYPGEPSGTDTDGTAENYLMLWNYGGVWGYNDMRSDPAGFAPRYYRGSIGVFCQN